MNQLQKIEDKLKVIQAVLNLEYRNDLFLHNDKDRINEDLRRVVREALEDVDKLEDMLAESFDAQVLRDLFSKKED